MSRFVFSLLLTLAFVASSTTDLFAQASRGRRKADVGASKESPAPAGGLVVTVPEFGEMEAGRGPKSVFVKVEGGKAPYTATLTASVDLDTIKAKLETVADKPDQFKLSVNPPDAGEITLQVKVSDSSEQKMEAESREVVVKVVDKKTNLDDVSEQIGGLEQKMVDLQGRAEVLKGLFATSATQSQVKDLAEQVEAVLSLLKYGAIGAFILFVVFLGLLLLKRNSKGAAKGGVPHAIAVLLLFGAADVRAAGPKVTCGDLKYNNNSVPDDGTEIAMACRGVTGKTIEVVDSKVTVSDVKAVLGGVSFKIKASSGATPDYPVVKIDGKEVEASLEIVPANEWISRDRTAVTMKQMMGGGEEKEFRSLLRGLAELHGLDYNKLLKLISSPKPGTSREAVAMIEQARENRVKGAVFEDSRYKLLQSQADAALKQVVALQAKVDGMSEGVSEDRVKTLVSEQVGAVHNEVVDLAEQAGKLAGVVSEVGSSLHVVTPAKKKLLGKDVPAQMAPVNADAANKAAEVQTAIQTWNLQRTVKK